MLYTLPVLGPMTKRLYSYFRKNIAFTDFIHVAGGAGVVLLIVGNQYIRPGIILVAVAVLGHVYAYINGDKT